MPSLACSLRWAAINNFEFVSGDVANAFLRGLSLLHGGFGTGAQAFVVASAAVVPGVREVACHFQASLPRLVSPFPMCVSSTVGVASTWRTGF